MPILAQASLDLPSLCVPGFCPVDAIFHPLHLPKQCLESNTDSNKESNTDSNKESNTDSNKESNINSINSTNINSINSINMNINSINMNINNINMESVLESLLESVSESLFPKGSWNLEYSRALLPTQRTFCAGGSDPGIFQIQTSRFAWNTLQKDRDRVST